MRSVSCAGGRGGGDAFIIICVLVNLLNGDMFDVLSATAGVASLAKDETIGWFPWVGGYGNPEHVLAEHVPGLSEDL